MAGSNFSIINGSDGVSKVPISTSNDANGNTVVGHVVMTSISGVATPIDATHPLAMTAAALPLPTGAATDTTLAGMAATLIKMGTAISALQSSEAPYQGVVAIALDQAQTPQRAIRINCTVAGNVSLAYVDGSKDIVPVQVGLSYIPGAITTVNSAGTTATATYANMK